MKLWIMGLALSAAVLTAGAAVAGTIEGVATNLAGSNRTLISYRHQRHMFVTSDGRVHALMNLGATAKSDNTLYLRSMTPPAGTQWVNQLSLSYSDDTSVSDGVMLGDVLRVVWQGKDGYAHLVDLTYDAATQKWAKGESEKVPRPASSLAVNPSLTVDSAGNTWVSYVRESSTTQTATILVYKRDVVTGVWSSTGKKFTPDDAVYPFNKVKRSARLVTVPDADGERIGMVYTYGPKIYWNARLASGAVTAKWAGETTLYDGQVEDNEPMSSHFSTQVDGAGNVHLVFTDQGMLYLTKRLASTKAWNSPTVATKVSSQATYAQLALLGGTNIAVVTNYWNTNTTPATMEARVMQSADAGRTWACTNRLAHDNLPTDAYYNEARVELPAFPFPSSAVPVLQQYQASDQSQPVPPQYAMYFSFTQSSVAGCQ